MNINFDNNVPIYIQIVEYLKLQIISGKMLPNEKLPSVRDLAYNMKVNPNTMQKALSDLEDLELIYTERTNGKFVTTNKKIIEKYKKEYIEKITKNYINNMSEIGIDINEIKNIIGGNNEFKN